MRIHTNLTYSQMRDALSNSGAFWAGYRTLTEHKSSSHPRAFEVALTGSSNSRPNSGTSGASDDYAATWDEWGAVMAAIFDADPDARMGGTAKRPVYADRDHFHFATGDRFRPVTYRPDTYLPEDTHARHSWDYEGEGVGFKCRKCSATRPSNRHDILFRLDHKIGA